MRNSKKFSPEYYVELKYKMDGIEKYLESQTSYFVSMDIEFNENYGYLYSIKISAKDNFSKFKRFIIHSKTKPKIKAELLENTITSHSYNNGDEEQIVKGLNSSIHVTCSSCQRSVNTSRGQIHRNIYSHLFKNRCGYALICQKCATEQFMKIIEESDNIYLAFWWICSCYDRRFSKNLVDKIKSLSISPLAQCTEYFSQLNMEKNRKGYLFSHSDVFDLDMPINEQLKDAV